jgi:outer membrane protein assembly factor BamD (BamD/ComL family)
VARVDAFVRRYPQHALASQALMQLGDYYQQSRQTEKAAKTYQEILHHYPNSEWAGEAQFRFAFLLKGEGKGLDAIGEMEKFIKQHPDSHLSIDARVELADLYLSRRDYAKALENYQWVVHRHPQDPLVQLDLLDLVFHLEQRFRIKISPRDIERRAQHQLSGIPLEVDGIYTREALCQLRKSLPEVPGEELSEGLRSADLPRCFRVATFVHLVTRLMEEQHG